MISPVVANARERPGHIRTMGRENEQQEYMNTSRINAQELSSRKLWQLAETRSHEEISADELSEVIAELAKRCHDQDQLRELDKLEKAHQG